ncbi:YfhO family protein [Stratiformator vulcanicus]|uniref:Bacterial membrane protein YfhO n=1 Tax=Stratiformator vulcanicus TaxID=2527980 RepID=A0A517QVV8_9PLAN|nr:YfhO family protein [Stratiformator vulcanicus]QDT35758.1 Bacterial membrane protein YfhO [Stratiformator vulcanicus]
MRAQPQRILFSLARDWPLHLTLVALTAVVFRDLLFRGHLFALRDASAFYQPLTLLVIQTLQSGELPLWTPLIHAGMPLLAYPTSTVLYPPKLIFLLLPFQPAVAVYIIGHVLLAAYGMNYATRRFGGPPLGAALAGLSYAFGGYVLFQTTNWVFLCGAAWLPFGLVAVERVVRRGGRGDVVRLSLILTLFVLCGDAQTGYLLGIAAAILLMIRVLRVRGRAGGLTRAVRKRRVSPAPRSRRWFVPQLLRLSTAALLAIGLSAAQLLPTLELVRRSERAEDVVPRSIWGVSSFLLAAESPRRIDTGKPANWYDAILGDPPPPARHDVQRWLFSVSPFATATLLSPSILGQPFPNAAEWGIHVGLQPKQVWVPSLYAGLLTAVGGLLALRLRTGRTVDRWLSWTALVFLLGSFGVYGPVWLCNFIGGVSGLELRFTGGIGGVYWWMNTFLPGFDAFRFPAKLMILFAAPLSILFGLHFEATLRFRWAGRILASITGLAVVAALGVWLSPDLWTEFSMAILKTAYRLEGTIKPNAEDVATLGRGRNAVLKSLCFTSCVGAALLLIRLLWLRSDAALTLRSGYGIGLLVLLAVDVGTANAWMIQTVPASALLDKPRAARLLETALSADEATQGAELPVRVYEDRRELIHYGDRFLFGQAIERGEDRAAAEVTISHGCLSNLHGTIWGISPMVSSGTVTLPEYQAWLEPLSIAGGRRTVAPRRGLDLWGVDAFTFTWMGDRPAAGNLELLKQWHPTGQDPSPFVPGGEPTPSLSSAEPARNAYLRDLRLNPSAFPRAWVVHDVLPLRPLPRSEWAKYQPLMQKLLYPGENAPDLRRFAIVEDEALFKTWGGKRHREPVPNGRPESIAISTYEPTRVRLEVELAAPGLVVLADQFYAGWTATRETADGETTGVPIVRTNRAMRGIYLPEGRHLVTMTYRPLSVTIGSTVSGLSFILCFAFALTRRRGRRN